MSAATSYPHLERDDAGSVSIVGSRYKVLHLAGEHYHYGWSAEELLRQHPDLKPEEIYAALTYFYDHHEELVNQLHESAKRGQQSSPSFSREELLRRRPLAEPA